MKRHEFELTAIFIIWVFLNILALGYRLMVMDCKDRYIDYIAPLSFIHCEVK